MLVHSEIGSQNGITSWGEIVGGIGKADKQANRRKGWSLVNLAHLRLDVQRYKDVVHLKCDAHQFQDRLISIPSLISFAP
jgi:hypothetical protein